MSLTYPDCDSVHVYVDKCYGYENYHMLMEDLNDALQHMSELGIRPALCKKKIKELSMFKTFITSMISGFGGAIGFILGIAITCKIRDSAPAETPKE